MLSKNVYCEMILGKSDRVAFQFSVRCCCAGSKWSAVWAAMFRDLLNVRSCSEMPDLMTYRKQLSEMVEAQVTAARLNAYVDQLQRQLRH